MAWRIDESVIRGEIDNRTRDRVTGRIWFEGRAEPVELNLTGNAWRDLAGRRLEFVNPVAVKKPLSADDIDGFATRQTGTIGDCTASRKVKVPEVTMDELMELFKQRKPFPWHWGNSLHLEWFSETNGRVVIESASYLLTVSPDMTWDMTADEEAAQQRTNAGAMGGFIQQLGEAVASEEGGALGEDKGWNEGAPQSEAEAEKMQHDRVRTRTTKKSSRKNLSVAHGSAVRSHSRRRKQRSARSGSMR